LRKLFNKYNNLRRWSNKFNNLRKWSNKYNNLRKIHNKYNNLKKLSKKSGLQSQCNLSISELSWATRNLNIMLRIIKITTIIYHMQCSMSKQAFFFSYTVNNIWFMYSSIIYTCAIIYLYIFTASIIYYLRLSHSPADKSLSCSPLE
jgi:hypothetical protein